MDNSIELEHWTFSASERSLILAKRSASRLRFALLLKYFATFGRFPTSLKVISPDVVQHVAAQIDENASSFRALPAFPGRTEERYRAEIRAVFGFRETTSDDATDLTAWLRDHAVAESRDRENLVSLLEDECRRRCLEPPASDRSDRIVRAAVHAYEERLFFQVYSRLSPLTRTRLDDLLRADGVRDTDEETSSSRAVINNLRDDPGRAGVNSIRDEMAKLEIIRNLELPLDVFGHTAPHEVEMYRQRVAVETPREIRRHPEQMRLTLLACFAYSRGRTITDSLTDLLIDTVHRINAKAERRVSDALLDDLKRVTGKTNILFQLADATLAHPDGVVRDVVFPIVSEATLRELVKEWKATGPAFRNTLRTYIRGSYQSHYRQMVPQLLKTLDFRSNNEAHRPVIEALEVIKRYAGTKLRNFPADENVPLDFVPPLWRDAIIEDDADGRPRINRITYEIAALNALRDQVRCKEIHIAGANRYRNPDEDVPTNFDTQRDVY
jgi:hypothetical protein